MTDAKKFGSAIGATLLLILLLAAPFASPATSVASAAGIPDMVSDELVLFYEQNIAREPFVSSMSASRRKHMEETYSLSRNRLNCCLLLQDLGARTGNPKTVDELSKMTDKQIVSTGKTLIKIYSASLSPEENAELSARFKEFASR